MPRPKKELARDTRTLALGVTQALLHQHGYLGVSLDEVARRVGVRQASLYHHFPGGKNELVLEVARAAIDHDARGFERAIGAHEAARDRLLAVATFMLSGPVRTGRTLQEATRFLAEEHQARIYADFHARAYAPVRRIFEEGAAAGELRPHDARRAAWAFLDLTEQLGTNPEEAGATDLAHWIVSLMLDGLAH